MLYGHLPVLAIPDRKTDRLMNEGDFPTGFFSLENPAPANLFRHWSTTFWRSKIAESENRQHIN